MPSSLLAHRLDRGRRPEFSSPGAFAGAQAFHNKRCGSGLIIRSLKSLAMLLKGLETPLKGFRIPF